MSKNTPRRGSAKTHFLLLLLVLSLLLSFSPADEVQAQTGSICQFQDPFVNATSVSGFHTKVAGGWQGNDVISQGVKSLFADGGVVDFAGYDDAGGGNGFIIRGIGPCSSIIFAAWHNDAAMTIQTGQQVDPTQVLVTPGVSGKSTGPHNHVTVMSSTQNLCGIPMERTEFTPDNKYLGDAWVYDINDVISYCGTSATTTNTSQTVPIIAERTFTFPNLGESNLRHNAAYWYYMAASGQNATTDFDQFSGAITIPKDATYYAVAMAGGNFDTEIGYRCYQNNCDGNGGLYEGYAVCDAIATFSTFVDEATNGCIDVSADAWTHGSSGYQVPEAKWSIAVSAPKGTGLIQDPTVDMPNAADVAFTNNCGEDITIFVEGSPAGVTLRLAEGNYPIAWQATTNSGTSVPRLPLFQDGDKNPMLIGDDFLAAIGANSPTGEPTSEIAESDTPVTNFVENLDLDQEAPPLGEHQMTRRGWLIVATIIIVILLLL